MFVISSLIPCRRSDQSDDCACKPSASEGVLASRANHEHMTEHEAIRTLVKSPPELWAECSDPSSLARHLGEFGEIKITRLEPETAVAWEGEHASGTVRLEPSGWGTRVVLTARGVVGGSEVAGEAGVVGGSGVAGEAGAAGRSAVVAGSAVVTGEPPPNPEPLVPKAERLPPAPMRRGFMPRIRAWLAGGRLAAAQAPIEPQPGSEPQATPEPATALARQVAGAPPPAPELAPAPRVVGEPQAASEPSKDAEAMLAAALNSLGQAHHRPYSRP